MPSLLDFLFDPQGRSELLGGFLPPDSKWPFEGAGPRNTGTSAADIDDPNSAYNRGLLGDVLGRPQMAAQLMDPRVRDRLIAYTQAEVGNQGPEAQQAFIESSLNRAVARGQPLPQTLSGSYFPDITHSRAMRPVSDAARAQYGPIIDAVLGGSNLTQFGTGNASGTVGFAGGPQTFAAGGERFGIEGPDRGWQDRGHGGLPPEILFGQSAPQPGLPPGASAYDAPAGSTAISGTELPPAAAGRPPTRISIDPRTRTSGPLVAPGGSAMPPGGPAVPGGGPQAPQGGPGGPGIGDRLTAALTGFTYAGGLPEAIGNVIMGLGTGQRQDVRGISQQNQAAAQQSIYQALIAQGASPAEAAAAASNPEFLKTLIARAYPESKFEKVSPGDTAGFATPPGLGGRRPGTFGVVQQGGVKPEEVSGTRKEITALPEVKRYSEAIPIYRSMAKSVNNREAISDLDFVYGVAKIFDPESVVREGEMKLVGNAQSIPDQIQGYMRRAVMGQGQLSPEQRAAILRVAHTRMTELKGATDTRIEPYKGIAERGRINPADILPSFPELVAPPEAPRTAADQLPQTGRPVPPPNAIKALRGDPRLIQQFEQKYGPGSAKKYLGAQ